MFGAVSCVHLSAHETRREREREKAIKYASTTKIHKKSIGKAGAINQSAVCFCATLFGKGLNLTRTKQKQKRKYIYIEIQFRS
jgi:hypothetical protein